MNKVKNIFLALVIITGLLSILTFIPNELLGFELRVKEYILLYDGPIQFTLISLTSFLLLIFFMLRKKRHLIIVFSIVTMSFLGLAYLFSLIGFGPQVKEDRIIYQNSVNESEKLIFQYYEVGIGGNPRWKAIRTKNISEPIRRIKNVNIDALREKVGIGEFSFKLEKLQKKIDLNNDLFELEKVIMFRSDSVIHYK